MRRGGGKRGCLDNPSSISPPSPAPPVLWNVEPAAPWMHPRPRLASVKTRVTWQPLQKKEINNKVLFIFLILHDFCYFLHSTCENNFPIKFDQIRSYNKVYVHLCIWHLYPKYFFSFTDLSACVVPWESNTQHLQYNAMYRGKTRELKFKMSWQEPLSQELPGIPFISTIYFIWITTK